MPPGVPVAGGTACRPLAFSLVCRSARVYGHAPDIGTCPLAPPCYLHQVSLALMSTQEAATPPTPRGCIQQFQSNARSPETANRSGKNHRRYAEQDDGKAQNPSAEYKGSHSPQRPAVLLPQTKLIKTIRMASRFPSSVQISQRPPQLLRQRHSILRMRRTG